MNRIVIIVGHYGSGKTEVTLNMAIKEKKANKKVAIVDLDIANPYFRSRERQQMLEKLGVEIFFNTYGFDISEDLPAITARIRGPLENKAYTVFVDVGGNDSGAKIIAQFGELLETADIYAVINGNRYETRTVEGALNHLYRMEKEMGKKITGVINNTHMLRETTIDDIIKGEKLGMEISKQLGCPLIFTSCLEEFIPMVKGNSFPINLYMRPDWLDAKVNEK